MTSKNVRKATLTRIDELEKFKEDCEGAIRIITDELAAVKEENKKRKVTIVGLLLWIDLPWWKRVFARFE